VFEGGRFPVHVEGRGEREGSELRVSELRRNGRWGD
jgi:hypothetical protein